MSKENAKNGFVFDVELNGMDKIQEQVKDLNNQLDSIINKFEKIAELSKLKIKNDKTIDVKEINVIDSNGFSLRILDDMENVNFYKGANHL